MRMSADSIELSASDLSGFLSCTHLTALDLAVAHGSRTPPAWVDPVLLVLRERGLDHERGYVETLRAQGLSVTDLDGIMGEDAVARSVSAIRTGADVILQPALRNGCWFGRPDVLRRNAMSSALGAWSYEVVDTKLAKETRGGTILQLVLYSELVGDVQGKTPECFHVVTPDPVMPVDSYRVDDFAAYFRLIRNRLQTTSLQDYVLLAAENYPEPVDHCEICRWQSVCAKKRRVDDHLSLVAGMSKLHARELEAAGFSTLEHLGKTSGSANKLAYSSRAASRERQSTNYCCRSKQVRDWLACQSHLPAMCFLIWKGLVSRATADASTCSALLSSRLMAL
jgi:predicted RecB family nuclease